MFTEIYTFKGQVIKVDTEDYKRFAQYPWQICPKSGYARTTFRDPSKPSKCRIGVLHRLVTDAKKGEWVKHLNGDKLDNRKSNLKIIFETNQKTHKTFVGSPGQIFGELTIIKEIKSTPRNTKQGARFLCKCSCGKEHEATGSNLVRGSVRSCGHLAKLAEGQAAFNKLFYSYQAQANNGKRKYTWNLSEIEFRNLTSQNCYYCGVEPKQKATGNSSNGFYLYNGIDRIINSIGYELNNCVPCCGRCNEMKNDVELSEYLNHLTKICKHLKLDINNV